MPIWLALIDSWAVGWLSTSLSTRSWMEFTTPLSSCYLLSYQATCARLSLEKLEGYYCDAFIHSFIHSFLLHHKNGPQSPVPSEWLLTDNRTSAGSWFLFCCISLIRHLHLITMLAGEDCGSAIYINKFHLISHVSLCSPEWPTDRQTDRGICLNQRNARDREVTAKNRSKASSRHQTTTIQDVTRAQNFTADDYEYVSVCPNVHPSAFYSFCCLQLWLLLVCRVPLDFGSFGGGWLPHFVPHCQCWWWWLIVVWLRTEWGTECVSKGQFISKLIVKTVANQMVSLRVLSSYTSLYQLYLLKWRWPGMCRSCFWHESTPRSDHLNHLALI